MNLVRTVIRSAVIILRQQWPIRRLLPLIKRQIWSRLLSRGWTANSFDNDLLSVIAYETQDFAALNKFYRVSGNRHGEMLSALEMLKANRGTRKCEANKSPYLSSLDSLIEEFGDLPICGEVALEHYRFIDCKNATNEDRIKYIRYALSKWG